MVARCLAGLVGIAHQRRRSSTSRSTTRLAPGGPCRRSRGPPAPARPRTSSPGFAVGFETTAPTAHRDLDRPGRGLLLRLAVARRSRWRSRRTCGRRSVRHGRRDDGHADDRRLHPGDGHLRADHRQRWRHRRDVRARRRRRATSPTRSTPSATPPRRSPRATPSRSAALAAFLLFSAYLRRRGQASSPGCARPALSPVDLTDVRGVHRRLPRRDAVFFFSSLTIRAVGKAAGDIIEEVRRQFRDDPGIMPGTVAPGLRPLRRHHHQGRAPRDGRPGHPGGRVPGRRRPAC